ncbi:hypothetical protein ZYGR_0U03220 [Zygosaccharomyces rouxii]|uniref:ZYRO0F16016p n=2 Tax=Zygosaccharomyces rouxii TaxID=4956 RepID=C5DYV3_ZYGRC|nr:uncharacterized protein ZYRO0F16016g [Zygosaccharomyces rouxii]KAH9201323.1 protein MPA43 [Zygosaccharomyces rouxii]GAV50466.1 hypothetical protein ZYGR_0U03220 [Zygosaccharomyces rouxii]CAQ43407.1 Protein MPA43 [Zygosaccharomyces rouxii]CAR28964.1 ZYRO0F16016p [Zygosaccharomyces rouxii]
MVENKPTAGIGIDLGSSSVRVSLFNFQNDQIIAYKIKTVPYYFTPESTNWKYTQSSREILTAIDQCFQELNIDKHEIKSCGVGATCSLAIFQTKDNALIPWNLDDPDKNVVFWMDSIAIKETQEVNKLATPEVQAHMGGSFVPEMAVPKLRHFIDILKNTDNNSTFEIIDLHRYIAMSLAQQNGWDYTNVCNFPNLNEIGHDGELAGWSSAFYENVLQLPPNIVIGPTKHSQHSSKQGLKVSSCIDCYSNWFALLPSNLQNSLFIVGGTSTCYLYASSEFSHHIPGVWGPFSNIFDRSDQFSIYEAGQSCTGKLIEHLFKTHPASSHIDTRDWPHLFSQINDFIEKVEQNTQDSIHMQTKHMFFYGDLDGNRTPYADPSMSGMFIGETTDTSFRNLVYKYVSILEFIAFQIKHMLAIFNTLNGDEDISNLQFCGSLAKNKRLLNLLALLNPRLRIAMPEMDVALMGAYGSYLMGKASTSDKSIVEVAHNQTYSYRPPEKTDGLLVELLEVKYQIYFNMAEQQRKYRKQVNNVIENRTKLDKN